MGYDDKQRAQVNSTYASFVNGFLSRNLVCDLTFDDWFSLTQQPCYYCDRLPANVCNSVSNKNGIPFVYNGIDRKNNNLGYTALNSVTCCKRCNYAKHTMSDEEFLQLALTIAKKHFGENLNG